MGLSATRERCQCCGQVIPPRCPVCSAFVVVKGATATHWTDHGVEQGPDGHCSRCGLELKERRGRLGHVYDHPAQLPQLPQVAR